VGGGRGEQVVEEEGVRGKGQEMGGGKAEGGRARRVRGRGGFARVGVEQRGYREGDMGVEKGGE